MWENELYINLWFSFFLIAIVWNTHLLHLRFHSIILNFAKLEWKSSTRCTVSACTKHTTTRDLHGLTRKNVEYGMKTTQSITLPTTKTSIPCVWGGGYRLATIIKWGRVRSYYFAWFFEILRFYIFWHNFFYCMLLETAVYRTKEIIIKIWFQLFFPTINPLFW